MEHIKNFLVMSDFSKYPTPDKPLMALISLDFQGEQLMKTYTEKQKEDFMFNVYMQFATEAAQQGHLELIYDKE